MTLDDPVLIKVLSDEMKVYRLFIITMALRAVVDGCKCTYMCTSKVWLTYS